MSDPMFIQIAACANRYESKCYALAKDGAIWRFAHGEWDRVWPVPPPPPPPPPTEQELAEQEVEAVLA